MRAIAHILLLAAGIFEAQAVEQGRLVKEDGGGWSYEKPFASVMAYEGAIMRSVQARAAIHRIELIEVDARNRKIDVQLNLSYVTHNGTLIASTIVRTTSECHIKPDSTFHSCSICIFVPEYADFRMGLEGNLVTKGLDKEWHFTGSLQVKAQWVGADVERGKTIILFTLKKDPAGYLNFVMTTTVHITTLVVFTAQMFVKSPMTVAIVALVFIQGVFMTICITSEGPQFVQQKTRTLTDTTGILMIVNAICQEVIALIGRRLLGKRRSRAKF